MFYPINVEIWRIYSPNNELAPFWYWIPVSCVKVQNAQIGVFKIITSYKVLMVQNLNKINLI